MALQKLYQAETGQDYPLAYHKIQQIRIDLLQSQITVILWMYKDDTARLLNKQPIAVKEHMCTGADFPAVLPKVGSPNILVNLYQWLKQQVYQDALDV